MQLDRIRKLDPSLLVVIGMLGMVLALSMWDFYG